MSVHTRNQTLAQAAFARIDSYEKLDKEYISFAKKFPALIHTCGLAQAVAFAQAKGKTKEERKEKKPEMRYLEDLADVLRINSADKLAEITRTEPLSGYLRLSRNAINAASWLKRYVEAAGEEE
jgi:CRISPR-associated protein Cmr5